MSKSIDDYRNIVKILKLQLIKIRQQNSSLSHTLGIATQNETSSYSPKIQHYEKTEESFAKNILAFLNFAHRCELIGLAPEMVFRIADKKRDKKVGVNSFSEILKRIKLRMSEMEINQLVNLISRGNQQLFYDDYLKALSAFQINSQKYPYKSNRTYTQLCLLKFGKQVQSYGEAGKLYKQINVKKETPFLTFENYTVFTKKNLKQLDDYEIIAVFVGLDVNSLCKIERDIFIREMNKVFSTLERGVNIQQQLSQIKQPLQIESKQSKKGEKQKKQETSKPNKKEKQIQREDFGVKYQEETGQQAAAAKQKKPAAKKAQNNTKVQAKLSKGDSVKVLGQYRKLNIKISDLLQNLLNKEVKTDLVKSFTIFDFSNAIKAINKDIKKKKIMELFRYLDTQSNGTLNSSQLLKLWLRGKQITDSQSILYKLLSRHLKETQFPQPIKKFEVLGYEEKAKISESMFSEIFTEMGLTQQEVKYIMATYQIGQMTVKDFSDYLKPDGGLGSIKKFVKMDKKLYDQFNNLLQKIVGKKQEGKQKNFKKLMRLETGQKSSEEEYWETIFTDEWSCWQYCLQAAYKLQNFWRDPEFGPTPSDKAGIRSIVGNQSRPPPGLPDETQINWITFEQLLALQKVKGKVEFLQKDVNPNDIMQGKIGDCWYVSSLSIIANNPEYVKGRAYNQCLKSQDMSIYGVNPYLFKFFTKYGLYVFKYYKKFKPVFVVVDDLFPIQTTTNQLLFAKSPQPGMQWVAFFEKSYAKLHHSYSNMISGDISQGLNDLTNCLPIKEAIQQGRPQNMQKIKRLNDERQLMGCSISAQKGVKAQAPVTLDDEKCGLFYSHAYSILDFINLDIKSKKQTYNLIRVRNPWGYGQWNLDWSDKPKDNNDQYKSLYKNLAELKKYYETKVQEAKRMRRPPPVPYVENVEDGQFLMKFQDFNKVYTNLFTGYNLSNKYQCQKIQQKWDSQYPSGICSVQKSTPEQREEFVKNNHQYILTIKQDDTDVLMYIIQEDGRLYRGEKYPYKQLCNATMIMCFNLKNQQKALNQFDIKKIKSKGIKFELRREVNMWQKLKAGKYAIIPCKIQNDIEESEFQFRIYYDKPIKIEKVKGHNNVFTPLEQIQTKEVDKASYEKFLELIEKNK